MAKINGINNETAPITIDPGVVSDSYIHYDVNGVSEFTVGVDTTDDSYRISRGAALGTNDTFIMSSTGQLTMPLQPVFLAVMNTTVSNATGAGVTYTVVWDTEVFDQGSNFSSTTFTAPVTGKYKFESNILMGDLSLLNNNGFIQIVTSNRTYFTQVNPGGIMNVSNESSVYVTFCGDMDVADTAIVEVNASGGTQIVDVLGTGSSTPGCWFSGNLEV